MKEEDGWTTAARISAAAFIPPVVGFALVYLGAVIFAEYGWVVFVLLPVFLGFASAVLYDPKGEKGYGKCFLAGLSSLISIGILIIVWAVEGLICLVMALPVAVPLMTAGSLCGWALTRYLRMQRNAIAIVVIFFLAMPFAMSFETSDKSQPTLHQVVSTVEIDAPIGTVWKNVIEFPQIDTAPEGILNLGFAYPINAKIEGAGVGAIRYCNFNTGPFVEPITAWQEPTLLAFDVKEQPAPMTELSPYENLHAAHFEYIRSRKGQFRLYEKDGKTVVEGTTYYTHDIAPDIYWKLYSDEIIHQIHLRVLNHIKEVSEK
jgi:hypothetical protein